MRRLSGSIAAMTLAIAASSMASGPTAAELRAKEHDHEGRQPHGHRSSQGSTSNRLSRAEKKRRNKLAKKGRQRSRR